MHLFLRLFIVTVVLALGPDGHADWRDELKVFRIGLAAEGDVADSAARAEPFRLALEEALGIPVEIFAARDYPALITSLTDQRIEYAILSPIAYAAAYNLCECVEPLVSARTATGTAAFRPVIIGMPQGIGTLEGLRGRTLAVAGGDAVGGNSLAFFEMRQAGLDPEAGDVGLRRFATSEAAIDAFLSGEADALLGWAPASIAGRIGDTGGSFARLAILAGDSREFVTAWMASPIPLRTHAIRRNLPTETKTILRSLLTGLFDTDPVAYDSIEPVYGGGFIAARNGQFAALSAMLAARGIETETIGAGTREAPRPASDSPATQRLAPAGERTSGPN